MSDKPIPPRAGANTPGADAIQAELQRLFDANNGRLTPEQVVDAARSPASPLHARFDWSDADAAAKWRLEQARGLIRSVRLVVETKQHKLPVPKTPPAPVAPMAVRDPTKARNEQGYVAVSTLRDERENARDAVLREVNLAASAVQRATAVAAALDVGEDLTDILRRLEAVRARLRKAAA